MLSTVKKVEVDLELVKRLAVAEEILLPIAAPVTTEYLSLGIPHLLIGAQCDSTGNLYGPNCEGVVRRFFALNRDKVSEWRNFRKALNWVPVFASFLSYLLYLVLKMHPFEVQVRLGNPRQELVEFLQVRGLTKALVGGVEKDGRWVVYEPVFPNVASDSYRRCYFIQAPTFERGSRIFLFMASLLLASMDAFKTQTKKEWEVFVNRVDNLCRDCSGIGNGTALHQSILRRTE